ncbi:spike base protein, RCAP_Rcc01079 family [Sphingobium estronivorans]|uniref:spike base protein, RCAP_Rcc01079 family n=1 Tax=Sphingobium estronivorans TaxID=1577690 RepID=UPI00123C12D9|nr:hypothetical protein [Sphingobium estronivorans]
MDKFEAHNDTAFSPARHCFLIQPHDTQPLSPLPKALRVDGDGVVMLRAVDSDADVAHPVKAGEIVPVRAAYIRATGTTGQTSIMGYA